MTCHNDPLPEVLAFAVMANTKASAAMHGNGYKLENDKLTLSGRASAGRAPWQICIMFGAVHDTLSIAVPDKFSAHLALTREELRTVLKAFANATLGPLAKITDVEAKAFYAQLISGLQPVWQVMADALPA